MSYDYNDASRISNEIAAQAEFTRRQNENITNPRSQGCPRFQSGEELANNVGKINAHYSL